MWWISVSDTILQWTRPPTGMVLMQKCLIFEVRDEHLECCLLCGACFLPRDCLEFPQMQLLVFVLSIGMFVFSVPHSSLMMYTSVSRGFLSCLLFIAVIDTEACVIKTHQSRHYSTVICTELSGLSVKLSLIWACFWLHVSLFTFL